MKLAKRNEPAAKHLRDAVGKHFKELLDNATWVISGGGNFKTLGFDFQIKSGEMVVHAHGAMDQYGTPLKISYRMEWTPYVIEDAGSIETLAMEEWSKNWHGPHGYGFHAGEELQRLGCRVALELGWQKHRTKSEISRMMGVNITSLERWIRWWHPKRGKRTRGLKCQPAQEGVSIT